MFTCTSFQKGEKYSLSNAPTVSFLQKKTSQKPSFEKLLDKFTIYTDVDTVLQIDLNAELPSPLDVNIEVFDFQTASKINNSFIYGKKTKKTLEKNKKKMSLNFKFIHKKLLPYESLALLVSFETKEDGIIYQILSEPFYVLSKRTEQCIKRKSPEPVPYYPPAKISRLEEEYLNNFEFDFDFDFEKLIDSDFEDFESLLTKN
jgi:hypothetical protein